MLVGLHLSRWEMGDRSVLCPGAVETTGGVVSRRIENWRHAPIEARELEDSAEHLLDQLERNTLALRESNLSEARELIDELHCMIRNIRRALHRSAHPVMRAKVRGQ